MAGYKVAYDEIRRQFTVEQVAGILGLELKPTNGQLRGECPVGGGTRSLVITPGKGFTCFAPTCQKQAIHDGFQIELYAHVKQLQFHDAATELNKLVTPTVLPPLTYLDAKHPAVQNLGISEDTAVSVGIGYAARGTLIGRVAIPIRDEAGRLLAYVGYGEHLKPPLKFGKFRL